MVFKIAFGTIAWIVLRHVIPVREVTVYKKWQDVDASVLNHDMIFYNVISVDHGFTQQEHHRYFFRSRGIIE